MATNFKNEQLWHPDFRERAAAQRAVWKGRALLYFGMGCVLFVPFCFVNAQKIFKQERGLLRLH